MRYGWHGPALVGALITGLVACTGSEAFEPEPTAVPSSSWVSHDVPTLVGREDYSAVLARIDSQIAVEARRADERPREWMVLDRLANAYLSRARLTGELEDFMHAERALDRAFERAPTAGGPVLTRADFNLTLHRLDRVEPDLAAAERGLDLNYRHVTAMGIRGDVHLASGRYAEALESYGRADEILPTPTSAFRLAQHAWSTGDFSGAEWWIGEALRRIPGDRPKLEAYLHLQLGLMDLDRGRLDAAMAHYLDGASGLGGWWLLEEHMAEIDALVGRHERAERAYRDLVQRTGSPELMDALADLLETRGSEEADALRRDARRIFEQQLEQLPEASYGHALPHFLASDDAARALELAEANFALRPSGEARTLLAQAHLKNGQLAEARLAIEAALSSAYESAELHATASVVFELAHEPDQAEQQRLAATAIHPDIMEQVAWLRDAYR